MANTVYANKVVEAKLASLLNTAVNTRNLMTIDDSLTKQAGETVTINTYKYNGKAETLTAGKGNTTRGSVTFDTHDYTVNRVQANFDWTDTDANKDPFVIEGGLKGVSTMLTNKMNEDFIAECKKATLDHKVTGKLTYDAVVDAIAKLNVEDESKLFIVIPNAWKAELRVDPLFTASKMGEIVFNGQIGTVSGLPVIVSKAVTDTAFIMSKEAVKLFLKKDVEVEQERDADTCTNSAYCRAYYIVALVDATQIVKITKTA